MPLDLTDVQDFYFQFRKASPYASYQELEVTFGSADTDMDIRHSLKTDRPDNIDYQVLRADRATSIYHDQSATRKVWGDGYIILRSSAANAVVRLLLTVRRP